MQTPNDIRAAFLDYFASRTATRSSPSSPLVPRNDPTLMFTNAGMVQFKNVFTGAETRPYKRAATAQKCVRAGGKHNDLDNVGYTARHHTFFEMLGNFSFGDYFKEGAIELAWKLITKEFGLAGGQAAGHRLFRPTTRRSACGRRSPGCRTSAIIRIPTSDNFWSMGDTGPCGPCSEIFYDHGDAHRRRPARQPGRGRRPLHRDLEPRLHAVRAGRRRTSAIDLPQALHRHRHGPGAHRRRPAGQARQLRHRPVPHPDPRRRPTPPSVERRGPARGLATGSSPTICAPSSFLIADGVLPSNEGRGYVLRRIMRRAMRHAHMLGCQGAADAPAGADAGRSRWATHYPELVRAQPLITETLKLEEARFRRRWSAACACWTRRPPASPRAARCPARSPSSSTTPSASRST